MAAERGFRQPEKGFLGCFAAFALTEFGARCAPYDRQPENNITVECAPRTESAAAGIYPRPARARISSAKSR